MSEGSPRQSPSRTVAAVEAGQALGSPSPCPSVRPSVHCLAALSIPLARSLSHHPGEQCSGSPFLLALCWG